MTIQSSPEETSESLQELIGEMVRRFLANPHQILVAPEVPNAAMSTSNRRPTSEPRFFNSLRRDDDLRIPFNSEEENNINQGPGQ